MAINLCCPKCYKTYKLETKICKCGNNLKRDSLFKVRIKLPNGKWKSKQVNSLELAKKVEAKFKTQSVEQDVFNIHKSPIIDEVWGQYLKWAKQNKRSWLDDEIRWTKHISPHLKGTKMDKVTPHDIQVVLDCMKEKRTPKGTPYAPATIRQVLVLIKRVFNWGIGQELYHGLNPCIPIAVPKFDNKVTNPLNATSMESLMQVLASWENERAVLAIKFALYTGKRKGEICKLTWDCVDLETGHITLKSTNTKSKETQTLPMNNKALVILQRCHELEICDYVFPSNMGSYYSTLNET